MFGKDSDVTSTTSIKMKKEGSVREGIFYILMALLAFYCYYNSMNTMLEINRNHSNIYQEIIKELNDIIEEQGCDCQKEVR